MSGKILRSSPVSADNSRLISICNNPRLAAEALEARTLLTGLTIVPTFASNITRDHHAARIEAAINAAIKVFETDFSNPMTTKIEFQEGAGLGMGSYDGVQESYSDWRTALIAHATDANQKSAIAASVPAGTDNPVTKDPLIFLSPANARALGFEVPAEDLQPGGFDDVITLNTSICNFTRDSIDPNKYDLQDVAEHEIDEALGISSNMDGSGLENGDPAPADIMPTDLFRYTKTGKRSFNTNAGTQAYFSIDGGKTDLAQFNQDADGDFGDWISENGTQIPQVQDAFSTPGVIPPMNVELTRLDVIGYDPTFTVGTGIVEGVVFSDADADGLQDKGDADLAGWTIEAVQNGKVITSVTSDITGYAIGGLADGTYTIEVVPQTGHTQTSPASSYTITISGHNETISGKSFGETVGKTVVTTGAGITGTVFNDANGNGKAEASESDLAGIKVYLDPTNAGVFKSGDQFVLTNVQGEYTFSNLSPGYYRINTVPPEGFQQDFPFKNAEQKFHLVAGEHAAGINFAETTSSIITGLVYSEVNGELLRLAGVTVTITAADGVGPTYTRVSDSLGWYGMSGLPSESYIVTVKLPTSYMLSSGPASQATPLLASGQNDFLGFVLTPTV